MELPAQRRRRTARRPVGTRLVQGFAVPILLAGVAILFARPSSAQQQPIRFNHQVHVKQMTCIFCHRFYETREVAGRPELFRCMLCHAYPVSENPEAMKLRQFADQHQPLAWVRLTRLPPFVRFSHQRHVVAGKIACAACHGDIADATAPPTAPLVSISMNFCLNCHRSKAVQLDAGGLQALKADNLAAGVVAALQEVEHKRFHSSGDLLAAVSQSVSLGDAELRLIAGQVRPADPVTTDCFACHR